MGILIWKLNLQAVIKSAAIAASRPWSFLPWFWASCRPDHGLKFYGIRGGYASSRLINGFSHCAILWLFHAMRHIRKHQADSGHSAKVQACSKDKGQQTSTKHCKPMLSCRQLQVKKNPRMYQPMSCFLRKCTGSCWGRSVTR